MSTIRQNLSWIFYVTFACRPRSHFIDNGEGGGGGGGKEEERSTDLICEYLKSVDSAVAGKICGLQLRWNKVYRHNTK